MSFHRSRDERIFAGICGGIARRFDWSPTVVRVLYVLISVASAGFPGTLVYLLLWAAVPEEPMSASSLPPGPPPV